MTNDIKRAGAEPSVFLKNLPDFIFNVKFQFKDVNVLDELEEISKNDINITINRLRLLSKKTNFDIEMIPDDESEGTLRNEAKRKVVFKKDVEYDPLHSLMQNAIYKLLRANYKKEYKCVRIEHGRVDIKAKTHDGKFHYFEIKTDVPKLCIRAALGQIMEYAYWADCERAKKLIIVGDTEPDAEAKKYLQHIRNKFSIPVYYRCFNHEKNIDLN